MAVKYHNEKQGSEAWFKLRENKFTASMANVIRANGLGLETYIRNKKAKKEFKGNKSTQRGNDLEGWAVAMYESIKKVETKEIGAITNSKYEQALASPDRLVEDDGMIEVKCFEKKAFLKIKESRTIPRKVISQMEMQLMMSERKWNDFVLFHPEYKLIVIRIYPDKNIFDEIELGLKSARRLWEIIKI